MQKLQKPDVNINPIVHYPIVINPKATNPNATTPWEICPTATIQTVLGKSIIVFPPVQKN